jgi:hypothetical protein
LSLHPHVAGLIVTLDPRWRRKIFVGGLVLMIPIVGWPAVLGYRARFARNLFSETPAALPEWKGEFWGHVINGWRAMAVIFGHLAVLYAALAAIVWQRGWRPDAAWAWSLAFFIVIPGLSPLSFPIACIVLMYSAQHWLGVGEAAILLALFSVLIFMIPAGFIEVSRTGTYRSAFAWWRTWPFVWRHARLYSSAWWHAGLQSAVGHFCIPFTPWGVVWCFLGILALFNEVLVEAGVAPGVGWMQRALTDPRFERRGHRGRFTLVDGAAKCVHAFDFGPFSIPLPQSIDQSNRGTK